jgi:hypothetical protein
VSSAGRECANVATELQRGANYNFSWQTSYRLKIPKAVPRGSRIEVTAYFDNSSRNKFNPDPGRDVRYGEPTYDEMMNGYVEYAVEWPIAAKLDPGLHDDYVGRYGNSEERYASVIKQGDRLLTITQTGRKSELISLAGTSSIWDTEVEVLFFETKRVKLSNGRLMLMGDRFGKRS